MNWKLRRDQQITIAAAILLILLLFGWAPIVVEFDLKVNVLFAIAIGIVLWQGLIKERAFPKIK